MKKLICIPQLFAGGHSVTLVADDGFSAASASSTSDVQENAEVTLTLTLNTGYELADVEVLQGGVTVNLSTKKFTMGSSNVVLAAKSKKNNVYKVVENSYTAVNGSVTKLQRNMQLVKGPNGAIVGVDCDGTELSISADLVAALIKSGAIIKM